MTFINVTQNIVLVVNKIFQFLQNLVGTLLNNYVFRIILIISIITFLINLLFKVKNKVSNEEEAYEEEDYEEEDYDDEFWEE